MTDVRDVASAHILAMKHGKNHARYLLTGSVLAPQQVASTLQELTGIRPPVFQPPAFLMHIIAAAAERKARTTGQDAAVTRDQVRDVFGRHLAYDSKRAVEELGARFRPAHDVLRDAIRWLLFVDALKPGVAAKVRKVLGDRAGPDGNWKR